MRPRARPDHEDSGQTLVELVIAVAIMGVAVVAVVGAIAASVVMSDLHRKQTTASASVRNYAEAVAGRYDPSPSPSYSPAEVGLDLPAGFRARMTAVQCWDDAGNRFGPCVTSNAVQMVTLTVESTDARVAESLVLVVRP